MKTEIKIGGFGGQGVILSGLIIGKAATLFDNKHATMIQCFGPEARGSSCSAQVIVSDDPILYPYVTNPDMLVVMSQEAYRKFVPDLNNHGILLYEKDLVKPNNIHSNIKQFGIPATRFAEELKRKLVLNIIMLGFFTAKSELLSEEAVKKAIEASVPPTTVNLNLTAFSKGYEYGMQ